MSVSQLTQQCCVRLDWAFGDLRADSTPLLAAGMTVLPLQHALGSNISTFGHIASAQPGFSTVSLFMKVREAEERSKACTGAWENWQGHGKDPDAQHESARLYCFRQLRCACEVSTSLLCLQRSFAHWCWWTFCAVLGQLHDNPSQIPLVRFSFLLPFFRGI